MSRAGRVLSILLGLLLCLAFRTTLARAALSSHGVDCLLHAPPVRTSGVETIRERGALENFSHESAEPNRWPGTWARPSHGYDERAVLAARPLLDAAGSGLLDFRPGRASSQFLMVNRYGYDATRLSRVSRIVLATKPEGRLRNPMRRRLLRIRIASNRFGEGAGRLMPRPARSGRKTSSTRTTTRSTRIRRTTTRFAAAATFGPTVDRRVRNDARVLVS